MLHSADSPPTETAEHAYARGLLDGSEVTPAASERPTPPPPPGRSRWPFLLALAVVVGLLSANLVALISDRGRVDQSTEVSITQEHRSHPGGDDPQSLGGPVLPSAPPTQGEAPAAPTSPPAEDAPVVSDIPEVVLDLPEPLEAVTPTPDPAPYPAPAEPAVEMPEPVSAPVPAPDVTPTPDPTPTESAPQRPTPVRDLLCTLLCAVLGVD